MPESLVTVATYFTIEEAYLARNHLFAEGIEAFIQDQNLVAMELPLEQAIGGVKVQVPEKDAKFAELCLNQVRDQIKVGKKNLYTPEKIANRAFVAAGYSLLFPPLSICSLWLILRLMRSKKGLPPKSRAKTTMAIILDILMFGLTVLLIASAISGG